MYANLTMSIDISEEEQPKYNDWVDTYSKRDEAKQLLKSKLINMAIEFARTKNISKFERFVDRMSFDIPKKPEPSYYDKAIEDAEDLIKEYFMAEIVQQLIDGSEVSDDINNDYEDGDSIFHETIVDKDYSVEESIKLLNDLYKYEEEDSGLWEGQEWDRILATKAAYTYGNAVSEQWNDLIEQINEIDIAEIEEQIVLNYIDTKIIFKNLNKEDVDEFFEMDYGEQLDWIKDNFEDKFNDELKGKLEALIKELL